MGEKRVLESPKRKYHRPLVVSNSVREAFAQKFKNLRKQSRPWRLHGIHHGLWQIYLSIVKGFSHPLTKNFPYSSSTSSLSLFKLSPSHSTTSVNTHLPIFNFSTFSLKFLPLLLIFFTYPQFFLSFPYSTPLFLTFFPSSYLNLQHFNCTF